MVVVATGQLTIVDTSDGASLKFDKEYLLIPTLSDGSGAVFNSNTSVTASVYVGTADDSNTWNFSVVKQNVTCAEATTSKVQTLTGLSADTGWITITASKPGYSTLSKIFTVSKSKQGLPSQALKVVVNHQTFTYTDNVLDAGQTDIILSAILSNVTGTVTWTSTPSVTGVSGTGLTKTLSALNMGSNKQVVVTATYGSYSDTITLLRLDDTTAPTAYSQSTVPASPKSGDTWFYTGTAVLPSSVVQYGNAIPSTGYTWNGAQWVMTTPRGTYIGVDGIYTGKVVADQLDGGTINASVDINTPNINIQDDSISGTPTVVKSRGAIIGNIEGDVFINTEDGANWSKLWHEKINMEVLSRVSVTTVTGIGQYNYGLTPLTTCPTVFVNHHGYILCGGYTRSGITTSLTVWYCHQTGNIYSTGTIPWSGFSPSTPVLLSAASNSNYIPSNSSTNEVCLVGGQGGRLAHYSHAANSISMPFTFSAFSITGLTGDVVDIYSDGVRWHMLTSTGQIWMTTNDDSQNVNISQSSSWQLHTSGFTFNSSGGANNFASSGSSTIFMSNVDKIWVSTSYGAWAAVPFYLKNGTLLGTTYSYGIYNITRVGSYIFAACGDRIFKAPVADQGSGIRFTEVLNVADLGFASGYFTYVVGVVSSYNQDSGILLARAQLTTALTGSHSYFVTTTNVTGAEGWQATSTVVPSGIGTFSKRTYATTLQPEDTIDEDTAPISTFLFSGNASAGCPIYSSQYLVY